MTLRHLAFFILFVCPPMAFGQDMPLHEIIRPGETWKPFDGAVPETKSAFSVAEGKLMHNGKEVPLKHPVSCVGEWHGGSSLVVGSPEGNLLWVYRVRKDGTLDGGDTFVTLRTNFGQSNAKPTAISTDASNRLYIAAAEGVHVYDPTGRLCGVLMLPSKDPIRSMSFGGPDNRLLLTTAGDKVFSRVMLARGPSR